MPRPHPRSDPSPVVRAARAALLAALAVAAAGAADAASLSPLATAPARGAPMSQAFLSAGVSVVRGEAGTACVASAPIAIADSRYIDAAGAPVSFDAVRRSFAASVQLVHPLEPAAPAPFLRVQLKYPVAPGEPLDIAADGARRSAARWLEPSGDSLRIAEPAAVAALRRALGPEGAGVTVSAASLDTGRRIEDTLPALDLAGLDACVARGEAAARAAAPAPAASLGLELAALPTPATRVTPAEARACGMADPAGPVHEGAIRSATGFFAQTRRALVVFGPGGVPIQVHVPGVFEAGLARHAGIDPTGLETAFAADVSLSADRNDPLAPATAKGCLGLAPTTLCQRRLGPGLHAFGPCVTTPQTPAAGPDPLSLVSEPTRGPALAAMTGGRFGSAGGGSRGAGATRVHTGLTRIGEEGPETPPDPPPSDPPLPPTSPPEAPPRVLVTPLPAPVFALAAGLVALAGLARRRRRRA